LRLGRSTSAPWRWAREAACSSSVVYKIEQGRISPNSPTAQVLAQALVREAPRRGDTYNG